MSNSQPFPFLRLPPELRLIIYEHVSDGCTQRAEYTRVDGNITISLTLVTDCRPTTSILATCRLINQEAKDIVEAICHDHEKIRHHAPRIETDTEALEILRHETGLFMKVLECCRCFARDGSSIPVPWRLDDDVQILHECFTQYGYQPATGKLHGALSLRVFVKSAARAILFNKGPGSFLSKASRISIDLYECWAGTPRPSDLPHAYRNVVLHKLPRRCSGHVSVQRARSLEDLLKSAEFRRRWFQAITCSLDATLEYLTREASRRLASREEFEVFVVVGAAESPKSNQGGVAGVS